MLAHTLSFSLFSLGYEEEDKDDEGRYFRACSQAYFLGYFMVPLCSGAACCRHVNDNGARRVCTEIVAISHARSKSFPPTSPHRPYSPAFY